MGAELVLIEDDDAIALLLERALARDGYAVRRVPTGGEALDAVHAGPTDLVILDLGLPDVDGVEVCRRLRVAGVEQPILMLTARDGELDRVVGLDVGADDYLPKPFSLAELQARLRALLRRVKPATPTASVEADGSTLVLDTGARTASVATEPVAFTPKEFDLVALLHQERGRVVTRERLMDEVWDENWFGSTKTLDVTVARARHKLDAAGSVTRIVTVRGVGFRLEDEDDAVSG
jgi:DNA-binding response OmpR family regulator